MIIKNGQSFLNKQNATKRSDDRSDANSFDEMLKGANKKRKPLTKEKSTIQSRRKRDDQDVADADVKAKHEPASKKIEGQRTEPRNVEKAELRNGERQQSVSVKQEKTDNALMSKEIEAQIKAQGELTKLSKSQDINVVKSVKGGATAATGTLENLDSLESDKNSLVSLNLSGNDKKTLVQNEKIISDFENKMNQLAKQVSVNSQGTQSAAKVVMAQAPVPTIKTGQLKVEELKPADVSLGGLISGESSETSTSDVQAVAGDTANLNDGGAEMDSMFSQFMDQENTNIEVSGPEFSEEIGLGQGKGSQTKVENMQSIIKQARTFVDDGGGTMEIHMQPEGLGKVHLKVAVNNGQVNVEMQADNAVAKRALEEGLLDIKTALEGQKLLVETLKVEMSPDYQKDFSDFSNHAQEQENRDFAQQFLGQFQQGRESRTSGMFDSFKNFQRGQSEPELSLNSRNPYTENGKGRTLNLVA